MHYQPSYRSQEIPRLLPPSDSVPVTGRELRFSSLDDYRQVEIPERVVSGYDEAATRYSYAVNCMVCHGQSMGGDGAILGYMTRGPFPADLLLPITQDSADGELFAFISNGGRQGMAAMERGKESASPMPSFQYLLTEDERWMLVMYLRSQ